MTKRDLFSPPPQLEPAGRPSSFAEDEARAQRLRDGVADAENDAFLASPLGQRLRERFQAEAARQAQWQRALARRRRRLVWMGGALTAVAATIAVVAGVRLSGNEPGRGRALGGAELDPNRPPVAQPYDTEIGVKGASSLTVFRKRGADIGRVSDGSELFAGDRLRFSYATRHRYLIVVDVEERGSVQPFYPYPASESLRLDAPRGALEGSIELNESTGDERIVAVFSDEPLRFTDVAAAIERSYPRVDGGGPRALSNDAPLELAGETVTLRVVKRARAPR